MQNNIIEMEGIIEGYKAEDGKSPHKYFFLEDGKESTVVLNMWRDFNSKEEKAYIKPLIEEYGSLKELIGYKATVYVVEQKPQTDSEGNFVRSQYALSSITVGSNVGKPQVKQAVRATTNRFAGSSSKSTYNPDGMREGNAKNITASLVTEALKNTKFETPDDYMVSALKLFNDFVTPIYNVTPNQAIIDEPFEQVDQSYDEVV